MAQRDSRIIEAVPNFSEGRDKRVIEQIAHAIAYDFSGNLREGVRILHVDSGWAANRTVITLAGQPEALTEALFQGIRQATALIDMRKHQGVHPRIGATDVCPLIPLQDMTMRETVYLARQLARRVADSLQLPVFLYEAARLQARRKRLATIRKGEFEGLAEKMHAAEWQPDYGPAQPHPTAGAVVIGARPFLVAFNVHLNTTDVNKAQAIAAAVRETQSGGLPGLRAIGWYVAEYGLAQVSTNITDVVQTPLHQAFEFIKAKATEWGLEVKGSEIIGLVPLACLLNAGIYYAHQAQLSTSRDDTSFLVELAISQLGLNALQPFLPEQKILEYVMQQYPDVFSLHHVPLSLEKEMDEGIYP
ncbi:MAG: glutamate formimidoyltransferase [Thermoflavifilum sp.]|nr:glutamate formimidoyltransferase [Thermoflavifilum sp.]